MDLVDPDLRPMLAILKNLPPLVAENVSALREIAKGSVRPFDDAGGKVSREEVFAPGPADAPDVRVLVYRPVGAKGPRPALLHLHGGGYIMGLPEMNMPTHRELALEMGCVVVSVDYRLAPENCYPDNIEDCYAALRWLHQEAGALGIDCNRIGVSGESAGGGLAAALALLARDRGEFPIAFQHLIYPMLDDRTTHTATPHPHTGEYVCTAADNLNGWTMLLGRAPAGDDVSPYAAAARATDLSGLPPTFIALGALDLFLDEDMEYALRLTRAGVAVELHVYPGAYHGFQVVADAHVTQQAQRDSREAMARFLKGAAGQL